MKFYITILTLILLFGFISGNVFASGFHLSSISEVETGGRQVSHWWYTGEKPVFRGEAPPNSPVTIDIDGSALQVYADSSGDWVFTPVTALSGGDRKVKISNNGSEINFILTIGNENVDWNAVGSGSAQTLPTVGIIWPTMGLLIIGAGILMMGGKILFNA